MSGDNTAQWAHRRSLGKGQAAVQKGASDRDAHIAIDELSVLDSQAFDSGMTVA
jgi:hypothetical protein